MSPRQHVAVAEPAMSFTQVLSVPGIWHIVGALKIVVKIKNKSKESMHFGVEET